MSYLSDNKPNANAKSLKHLQDNEGRIQSQET